MYAPPFYTTAKQFFYSLIIIIFLVNTLGPCPLAQGNDFSLPVPGIMVPLSSKFNPPVLKGIKLDPNNPLRFDFYIDQGDGKTLKIELNKLIKYFLASLTIPEKDLWVNLSPYEKDRIVPEEFGQTEMGRDLLAEDYLLKQITASLIYPENQLGKEFWRKVYAQAQAQYGTTNIPINTFNKVWIVPDKAVVYENNGVAFVMENHLKVMLEEDYLSMQKHSPSLVKEGVRGSSEKVNTLGSQIVRQIVIPALTKEVNEGKNFAQLRQVFYSLILATWYKKKIKDSILNKVYSNRKKVQNLSWSDTNLTLSSPNAFVGDPERIYQQYLKAFKKGVFNYIKEEPSFPPPSGEGQGGGRIPRKYFSGGVEVGAFQENLIVKHGKDIHSISDFGQFGEILDAKVDFSLTTQIKNSSNDHAMESSERILRLNNNLILLCSHSTNERMKGAIGIIESMLDPTLLTTITINNFIKPVGIELAQIRYGEDKVSEGLNKDFDEETSIRNARNASLFAMMSNLLKRTAHARQIPLKALTDQINEQYKPWLEYYHLDKNSPAIATGMDWEIALIVNHKLGHKAEAILPQFSLLENLRLYFLAKQMNLNGLIETPDFIVWSKWVFRSIRYIIPEEKLDAEARSILYAERNPTITNRGGVDCLEMSKVWQFSNLKKPIIFFLSNNPASAKSGLSIYLDAPSRYDLIDNIDLNNKARVILTSLLTATRAFRIANNSGQVSVVVTDDTALRDYVLGNDPYTPVILFSPNDPPMRLVNELEAFYMKDFMMSGERDVLRDFFKRIHEQGLDLNPLIEAFNQRNLVIKCPKSGSISINPWEHHTISFNRLVPRKKYKVKLALTDKGRIRVIFSNGKNSFIYQINDYKYLPKRTTNITFRAHILDEIKYQIAEGIQEVLTNPLIMDMNAFNNKNLSVQTFESGAITITPSTNHTLFFQNLTAHSRYTLSLGLSANHKVRVTFSNEEETLTYQIDDYHYDPGRLESETFYAHQVSKRIHAVTKEPDVVLIGDDAKAEGLRDKLEIRGYQVKIFHTYREAIDFLKQKNGSIKFAIISGGPGINKIESLGEIRKVKKTLNIGILSALSPDELIGTFYRVGITTKEQLARVHVYQDNDAFQLIRDFQRKFPPDLAMNSQVKSSHTKSMNTEEQNSIRRQKIFFISVSTVLSISIPVLLFLLVDGCIHNHIPLDNQSDSPALNVVPTNNVEGSTNTTVQKVGFDQRKGGIDLNPLMMNMQMRKMGKDFKYNNLNGQIFDVSHVSGATFSIRSITPVSNLPEILGFIPKQMALAKV